MMAVCIAVASKPLARAITGLIIMFTICAGILPPFFVLYGQIAAASESAQCPAISRSQFHHNVVRGTTALRQMLTYAISLQLLEL